jgi:hypothetical protein
MMHILNQIFDAFTLLLILVHPMTKSLNEVVIRLAEAMLDGRVAKSSFTALTTIMCLQANKKSLYRIVAFNPFLS